MYQSFDTPSHSQGADRLQTLRGELASRGLVGFIVPRTDAHRGENVASRDERLRWLTGFTGSAGMAIALMDRAAVFIDGRYTLQAARQVDGTAYENVSIPDTQPWAWLQEAASAGGVIGFDPWLMTPDEHERYLSAAEAAGCSLRAEPTNPIDAIWPDQPPAPSGALVPYPLEFAGVASEEKRGALAETLRKASLDSFVLTLPDSIAWMLNVRGTDVAHTPIVLANAIVHANGDVDLFVQADRVEDAARAHLGNSVSLREPETFLPALAALSGKTVGIDRASIPMAVQMTLEDSAAKIKPLSDPCIMPKARKNKAELSGTRNAHLRDGAAMVRFLSWFDRAVVEGDMQEIKAANQLEKFRNDTGKLLDISFDSISGYAGNGAMPHYRVSRESDAEIGPNGLYLIDSGGQYLDGTTDITRTLAVGTPSADQIRTFTLVLKGVIAVSRAVFPSGTNGVQIDTLARVALWQAGFDFDHGTGHGVGAYLGVHEGPANLSKRGTVPLETGMILSNEPGYYREGEFGIRTENLLIVSPAEVPEGGERPMMHFETLTLAPIDLRLIDPSLLSPDERVWMDAYHARVYEALYPLLDGEAREWLEAATASLGDAPVKPGALV